MSTKLTSQAVWRLEMKRRENDDRIKTLYLEIKNMMTALMQYVISVLSS
jgi:hypothetical protein